MSDAAFELSMDEVGEHIADLLQAAREGNIVHLTEGGTAEVPFEAAAGVAPRRGRLAAVSGVLAGFEFDVDVEASRERWDRR